MRHSSCNEDIENNEEPLKEQTTIIIIINGKTKGDHQPITEALMATELLAHLVAVMKACKIFLSTLLVSTNSRSHFTWYVR